MSTSADAGWVAQDDIFGTRLAMVRQRMRWNVKEAALACSVTVQSWRDWEHGAACRRQEEVARKVSARTGCDYLWLFAGVVPPPPHAGGPSAAQGQQVTTRR